MKSQTFHKEQFANGVTLIGEQIDAVSSAAISLLVPCGVARDLPHQIGCSTLLAEMLQRGAGQYDSKQLSDQFESIGVHRSQSAGIEVTACSAAMLAEHLPRAIELFATMLLEPHLPEEELENSRELAIQDIAALEDEPANKIMTVLARNFYPDPFGRSHLGTEDGLRSVTLKSLREHYHDQFLKQGVILAVAGKYNWDEIRRQVEKCFKNWKGTTSVIAVPKLGEKARTFHEQKESAQVQIAFAYPSVSFDHADYYTCKVGLAVLSGGMAGRLFVEVREKRGLVYRVGAMHSAARGRAAIFASAGTTPGNLDETLQVMFSEMSKISEGVTTEELERARVEMKASLIMQSESSSSRASALVNDWWNLGRLRTLSEIRQGIESVTNEDIKRHFSNYPVRPVTLVTLGPKAADLSNVAGAAEASPR